MRNLLIGLFALGSISAQAETAVKSKCSITIKADDRPIRVVDVKDYDLADCKALAYRALLQYNESGERENYGFRRVIINHIDKSSSKEEIETRVIIND